MKRKNKLELYGTLGPSCCSKEILKEMFQAGMTGLRLNLSHTNLKDCESWLINLYEAAEEIHIVPDLLVDLQGPELRIGVLKHPIELQAGQEIRLCPISTPVSKPFASKQELEPEKKQQDVSAMSSPAIPVPPEVFPYLESGQTLRMDDGNILCKVKNVKKDSTGRSNPGLREGPAEYYETTVESYEATAEVLTDGLLKSRKSLAIDGCSIELPTLTSQDLENLKVLRKYRVTGVMLPFVRNSQDLTTLKKLLIEQKMAHIRIFAKIENQKGVEQLSSLLPHCDQIVIARGDLGNAYPLSQLPAIQKQISRTCLLTKTPFMVVTQMLASMESHPVPTRAEVSDIFNAVLDGASSLMLTGETAAGKYPAEAIRVLSDTAFEAQRYQMEARFSL